uniref:Calcium and integrin binding 1 (calmyrin) n=1 Tax=Salmo trutta TaxID=8032 RepID=A0A673XHG6_SALTR
MGTTASQLGKDLLSEYQISSQESVHNKAHKRFSELLSKEDRNFTSVPMEKVLSLPELKANPFRKRICHVFSTSDMKDGSLTFEDFLDLLSAFSDSATLEIKSHYAFCIFSNTIVGNSWGVCIHGCLALVNCLTEDTRLTPEEMRQLISNVNLQIKSDIDKDGTVNLSEFQHVIEVTRFHQIVL